MPSSAGLTGGYDVVLELNEELPNRLLLAYYHLGYFPHPQGTYRLPIPNAPPQLLPLLQVGYDIRLRPPRVDFTAPDVVTLVFAAQATLTVLGGIVFEIAVSFVVSAGVLYDEKQQHLAIDLRNAQVDATIDDRRLPSQAARALDAILAAVLRETLSRQLPFLDLTPFVSWSFPLPGSRKRVPVAFGGLKLTDRIAAFSVNLLGASGGDVSRIADFATPDDIGVALSEAGLRRLFEFWWDHGGAPRQIGDSGERELPGRARIERLIRKHLGAGFLASLRGPLVRVDGAFLQHDVKVDLDRPEFDVRSGNHLSLSGRARLHFSIKVELRYRVKKLNMRWKRHRVRVASWTKDAPTDYRVRTKLALLPDGRLQARVVQASVSIRGLPPIADVLINALANVMANKAARGLDPIPLGGLPLTQAIPKSELTVAWSPKLSSTDSEILVTAGVVIGLRGIKGLPASPFVANANPRLMEVHRAQCQWVAKIQRQNRREVFFLEEAYAEGYDNCHYCLGGSRR